MWLQVSKKVRRSCAEILSRGTENVQRCYPKGHCKKVRESWRPHRLGRQEPCRRWDLTLEWWQSAWAASNRERAAGELGDSCIDPGESGQWWRPGMLVEVVREAQTSTPFSPGPLGLSLHTPTLSAPADSAFLKTRSPFHAFLWPQNLTQCSGREHTPNKMKLWILLMCARCCSGDHRWSMALENETLEIYTAPGWLWSTYLPFCWGSSVSFLGRHEGNKTTLPWWLSHTVQATHLVFLFFSCFSLLT